MVSMEDAAMHRVSSPTHSSSEPFHTENVAAPALFTASPTCSYTTALYPGKSELPLPAPLFLYMTASKMMSLLLTPVLSLTKEVSPREAAPCVLAEYHD